MREYVRRLLGSRWFIETVADGRAALIQASVNPPDLVLSDVMMPELDGFGLLRGLRANPRTRDIPIILLSARAGEEARVEGLQAGADDYLVKPFSARELTARVDSALQLARIRKETQVALRESQQRFETLLAAAPLGIYLVDDEFRIREVNPTALPAFGEILNLIGRDFSEVLRIIWPSTAADGIEREFRRTLETGEPYGDPEYVGERLDRGVTEYYEWRINRIQLPNGRFGVVCYFRDIGAQVRAREAIAASQERLRQAAKMEAIGRLAGGLAHDFNNQLYAIRGFVGYAARDPGVDAQSQQDLLEVQKVVNRMALLTGQLLAFSRQQVLRRETLDLDQAVADSQHLLRHLLGSQIDFRIETEPGTKWVRVDRAQLQQVLLNLCINARDAMPDGGRLTVQSAIRTIEALKGVPENAGLIPPGHFVGLIISDTGTGISIEHLPHIFEPFFTTKEVGKGTGLGLATVHGIIAQSGGYIWAESTDGKGTRFTVLLPLAPAPDAPAFPSHSSGNDRATPARLLVVEDEEIVRRIVVRTLRDEGYEVLEAGHGVEALARLNESDHAIALVLTDVVMPVMSGKELAEHIAREYPHLPLVWMSGYPRDSTTPGRRSDTEWPFLQKPIAAELLVETVRTELARSQMAKSNR